MASSPSRIDRPLPFTRVIFSLAVVFIVVLLTSASRPCGAQPGANTQDGPIGPPEALYIDCGSNKSSNDSQGRNWLSDKPFMNGFKTALPADVRPSDTLSVDIPEAIVKTTRFFDDLGDTMPGDHCSIPVADNEAYWIRFTFPFYSSRQQGSNSDSVFDVWLYQAVRIATVNYSESGRGELPFGTYDILSLEIGLIPPSVQLNFSFVKRSGEGVHVSSIEILKLVNPESSGMFSNNFLPLRLPGPTVLRLEQRINCGGPHVNGSLALPYAYDEDRFYNISEKSIAVIGNITDNRASRVSAPSDILKSQRMAAEGANLTYSIPVTSGVKFVINAFWYELNKTLEKSGRQFKIFVDNFDATLEKDGKGREGVTTNDVFGTDLYSGGDGGRILIQLVPMPDQGNLPPIISGLEVYSLINLAGRTFPQDEAALREAAQELRLADYPLLGDPCAYTPNIIQCEPRERNASDGLAIVVFNVTGLTGETTSPPASLGNLTDLAELILVSSVMRGPIPDSWQNLTKLRYLDLKNNVFTGPIPDWLAELPSLEELHLDNNNFSGGVPIKLLHKLRENFTFTDNYNLCDAPGLEPCGPPSAPAPVPGLPSDSDSVIRSIPSALPTDLQPPPSSSTNSATTARDGSFKFPLVAAAASFLFLLSNVKGFTL